jgi:hypothetical protein
VLLNLERLFLPELEDSEMGSEYFTGEINGWSEWL